MTFLRNLTVVPTVVVLEKNLSYSAIGFYASINAMLKKNSESDFQQWLVEEIKKPESMNLYQELLKSEVINNCFEEVVAI